jgi:ComEC/Rec2-related protein
VNRPLVWAAVAFAAGVWLTGLESGTVPGLVLSSALLIALHRWPRALPYRDGFLPALIFLLIGAALEHAQRPQRVGDPLSAHNRQHPDALYRVEGRVADAPVYVPGMDYQSVRLRADRVWVAGREMALRGGVVLRWSTPAFAVLPGQRIGVEGRLDPVLGEVNFGVRGVEDFYRTHGYHSVLRIRGDAVEVLYQPVLHPRYWAARLRQWQAGVFARAAPPEIQPFLRAVWLGDRADISDEAYRPYLETGTAHILAVFGRARGDCVPRAPMAAAVVRAESEAARGDRHGSRCYVFALVAGARAPILRASLMVCLYLWAELIDREPDAPTALSTAALLFLLVNPGLVRDTGFALSFTSLASILIFSEGLNTRLEWLPRGLRANVAAAAGVSVLPFPLGAHLFHVIPVIGPVCNLVVIPLLGGVLWLCMLTVHLRDGVDSGGEPLWPCRGAAGSAYRVGHHAGGPGVPLGPCYGVSSPAPLAWICLRGRGPLPGHDGSRASRTPRRWLAGGAVALACTWALLEADWGACDELTSSTWGTGTPRSSARRGARRCWWTLAMRTSTPPWDRAWWRRWLLAQGVDHLDYVAVTHPDQDHIGGVAAVVDHVDVGAVVLWPDETANPLEQDLLSRCATLGIPVRRLHASSGLRVLFNHANSFWSSRWSQPRNSEPQIHANSLEK